MNEKEKELKSFNQCADALSHLEKKSIIKVFHMLSIHFEVMPTLNDFNNTTGNYSDFSSNEPTVVTESEKTEPKKLKAKNPSKKPKGSGSKDLTYLTEFDFRPSNNEALKDFFGKYKTSSNFEKNLVFIYYLQEVLKVSEITVDHVYSCYRYLNLKIPSLIQSLIDTKKAKGWIDTSDTNDMKVTRTGINFLEHEMPKSND